MFQAPQTETSPTPVPSTVAGGSGSRPATPAAPMLPSDPKPIGPPVSPPRSDPEPELIAQHYRGQGGKPIRITANYIRLEVADDRGVFEHEVKIYFCICTVISIFCE